MSLNKHLLESSSTLVLDSLKGLRLTNPAIDLDEVNKVVYLKKRNLNNVALISGGGSGHEPAHSGFVGDGMLTAAVCGNIFASPNASQVKRALEIVDNDAGILIIVKNYTGDVLNFGLAKEQFSASYPGKADRVRMLVVGDDVSVGRTQGAIVGRRGLAGTVLVYKIAGALAKKGASLDEVYQVAKEVAERVGTIGVGLDHCHVPATAPATGHLALDELEIGMGIHNEPGHSKAKINRLSELLKNDILPTLLNTDDPDRSFLPFHCESKVEKIVLLVNNLGGMSELEFGGIVNATVRAIGEVKGARKLVVERVISGTIMTSLNMPGFSITVLLLPSIEKDAAQLLELLDDISDTPGWKLNLAPMSTEPTVTSVLSAKSPSHNKVDRSISCENIEKYLRTIRRTCDAVVEAEPTITEMDQVTGDGDCGLTLKNGAESILNRLDSKSINGDNLISDIRIISEAVDEAMDGTSGALYSIFFSALSQALYQAANIGNATSDSKDMWAVVLRSSLDKLFDYTRARPPSRTLVDPLVAFIEGLQVGTAREALEAAIKAAQDTKNLPAKAGRSAYIDPEKVKGIPDPGAWGVKIILENVVTD